MLRVVFIRHSITEGNKLKRYIGVTDEPLCFEGISLLQDRKYPKVSKLYASPLIRCRQTARIIYPGLTPDCRAGLRETDFGDFENKNYKELAGNVDYQKWIDSNGTLPFPNGESQEEVKERCLLAFGDITREALKEGYDAIALVVHGGTIMTIMNELTKDPDYYKYMTKNGEGYIVDLATEGDNKLGEIISIEPIFSPEKKR